MTFRNDYNDRDRLIVAVAIALFVHGILFVLFPRFSVPLEEDFLPPMYVALDPIPLPVERPLQETPPVDEPDPVPVPVPEPEPVPDQIEPPPALEQTTSEPQPSVSPAPAATSPRPTAERTPAAESPVPERSPEPVPVPAPAPPPPARSFTRPGIPSTTTRDAELMATQIEEVVQMQEDYLDDLSEWQARQNTTTSQTEVDTPEVSSSLRSFQDALSRAIEGIRQAKNVVVTDPTGPSSTTGDESTANGDRSALPGVTIDSASGSRALTDGGAPDLTGLVLPVGFPPEFLVDLTFRVGTDGRVIPGSARLVRPTPAPQLDDLLTETVESWRFEPATGAPVVEGRVTIVIDTTDAL